MSSESCKKISVSSDGRPESWLDIDWARVEANVRGIQIRIAKATLSGKWRRVKSLQRMLTRSFSGRALAVRRVTENTGKRTSGVDKVLWSTPTSKGEAVNELIRQGYKAKPLRRVHIPKANGEKRPLGIPVMKDRAMQALHLLALQPVAESLADPNSYGFRIARSTHDAIEQCKNLLDKKGSAEWVFEADIKGCFDNIDHDWLLNNVPMDKSILRQWLKCGIVDMKTFRPTQSGTPQGGIISPTLANMALDGLEKELGAKFGTKTTKIIRRNKVALVRYADDFVITGSSKELLENEVKPLVEGFIAGRGLKLSQEKTRITHISKGFDFLGWNVRKYKSKLLIHPSKKNVKTFLRKCKDIFYAYRAAKHMHLIVKLRPVIKGWSNYHKSVASSEAFTYVDHRLWKMQWKWANRRHPQKSNQWKKDKYFQTVNRYKWVFATTEKDTKSNKDYVLCVPLMAWVPIERHNKVKMDANPFDPKWSAYFEDRKKRKLLASVENKLFKRILKEQDGKCAYCGGLLTEETGKHFHHIKPRKEGGGDKRLNLCAVHPVCHQQAHSLEFREGKLPVLRYR